MSSLGDVRTESTVYRSTTIMERHDLYYYTVLIATAIAGFLTMLGCASFLAGLAGAVGLAPLGVVRTVSYLGLGLAGAGSGGLLLLVLGDLRRTARHGISAVPPPAAMRPRA